MQENKISIRCQSETCKSEPPDSYSLLLELISKQCQEKNLEKYKKAYTFDFLQLLQKVDILSLYFKIAYLHNLQYEVINLKIKENIKLSRCIPQTGENM